MSKAQQIVARANAIVGMTRNQLGMPGNYAWCAHTVSEVLRYVGINDPYDLSCTRMKYKMAASENWDEPDGKPIPGDIIFFDWDHLQEELPLDHVAIVVAMEGNTVVYVNGNGNDSFRVTKQRIDLDNPCVAYWMRYVGDEEVKPLPAPDPEPTPEIKMCKVELEQLSFGCKSPSVETMQNLLIDAGYVLDVDGIFGNETKKILAEFQNDNELTADSICGPKTWKALIEAV